MPRWQKTKDPRDGDTRMRCKQDVRRKNFLETCNRLARLYRVEHEGHHLGDMALCEQHMMLIRVREGFVVSSIDRRKRR